VCCYTGFYHIGWLGRAYVPAADASQGRHGALWGMDGDFWECPEMQERAWIVVDRNCLPNKWIIHNSNSKQII